MSEENVNMSPAEQEHKKSSMSKGTKVAIGILGTAVCALSIALVVLMQSPGSGQESKPKDGRATFVSKENLDEVKEQLAQPVEDADYTTSMTIDWNFYDGKSVSTNAYVENAIENQRTVYFDVNLTSTGELVYSSPYLPVGEKMEGIALDKQLSKGDYPAILTYHLVDDNHEEITTVSVAITLHIQN